MIDSAYLRLSAQIGLLHNVTSNLRAVSVKSESTRIFVNFYFHGEISDDDRENCESVLDQVSADCHQDEEGNDIEFITTVLRIDTPQKLPLMGNWVYFRKE